MGPLPTRPRWSAAVLAVALLAAPACNRGRVIKSSLPDEEPPRRAAESFVHCVEAGNSGCVAPGENHGGWNALHLLLWMASGSPVSILEALPLQLAAHVDPLRVQGAFVAEVERYAQALRGAECESTSSQPVAALIDRASDTALRRLERLGMARAGFGQIIGQLREEAHDDLDGGHLVRLDCAHDPFRVYVATTPRDGRIAVVGMTTVLDPEFGGDSPSRRDVDERFASESLGLGGVALPVVEGAVDVWLPFPLEEL